jgi:hypothetical protein
MEQPKAMEYGSRKASPDVLKPHIYIAFYGCETWSLTLREERRLRLLENRVLRRIFGPKKEVTWEYKKLHKDKLNDLYS